jgi:hypothetical protein
MVKAMPKKKTNLQQPLSPVVSDPSEQVSPFDTWRYSPEPPIFDPESGERITGVAEDWRRDDPSLPWLIIRCHLCNDAIATRSLKRDVCESCGYRIRDDFYEHQRARIRRVTDRLVNPFRSVNPFNELDGSLPPLDSPSKQIRG